LAIAADLGVDQPIEGWDRRSASGSGSGSARGAAGGACPAQGEGLAVEYADPGPVAVNAHDGIDLPDAKIDTVTLAAPEVAARRSGASCPKVDSPGPALA
jgi:hypothetical protein